MNKDKMELEEIKEMLEKRKKRVNKSIEIYEHCYDLTIRDNYIKEKEAIEILLNLLQNSIPKKKIEDKIKKLKNCKMDIVKSSVHNVNGINKMLDRIMIKIKVLQELLEDK